ncbi:topoisomerase DNA-binding C4 zinc finger domain-containing protein [Candidatus Micrarchaeota archaeon]|nr:topoisomerase DNA-binding C4 zinc finger domain-containing protein [Candidatus Micrarchaeota archaeon]
MKLIVAEKPLAAKRIASILGKPKITRQSGVECPVLADAVIVPLKGHVTNVDFPESTQNWNDTKLDDLARAPLKYELVNRSIANALQHYASDCNELVIATDYDREGESIGREAIQIVSEVKKLPVKRARFSALTDEDVKVAFANLADFDYNLADSADSRREIDLIWGAALTRFISLASGRLGKQFLSVGRVQTPTLALCVDREKEIRSFVPKKFWTASILCDKNGEKFRAEHEAGQLFDKKEADRIAKLNGDKASVLNVEESLVKTPPPAPFNTNEFLRAASAIGLQPSIALSIAESLYINGFISYPRTDNTAYPKTLDLRKTLAAIAKVPDFKPLAEKLLAQKKLVPTAGKKRATDHPPIHPVEAAPKTLKPLEWKVYELVCRRFMATLAPDAELSTVRADLDFAGERFIARGKTILRAGWREYYTYSKVKEELLPKLSKGETAGVEKLDVREDETKPKPRYSPSALLKLMEEMRLGTKCLSGKTKVKVLNDSHEKTISLSKLFEYVKKGNNYSCVSIDGPSVINPRLTYMTRRMKDYDEQMYEVTFADGYKVSSTADHPFLVFNGKHYRYVPARQLNSGDRVIRVDNPTRIGQIAISWEDFLAACNKKTSIFAPIGSRLKEIRENSGISCNQFGGLLGVGQGNLSSYETGKRDVPLWAIKRLGVFPETLVGVNKLLKIRNPFPVRSSSAFARIIANFCGDGSIDFSKLARENCVDFRYSNTNPDLLLRFAKDVGLVFGYEPEIRLDKLSSKHRSAKYYVRVPSIIGRILFPALTAPGKYVTEDFYTDFIGAFFDDEGHAYKNERKIFISNTNNNYLKLLRKMLHHISVDSTIDENQHKLYMRKEKSIQKFLEKIPIASIIKKQRIIEMLSNKFKQAGGTSSKSMLWKEKQILRLLAVKDHTSSELSGKLSFSKAVVRVYLKRLIEKGLARRKILSKNHSEERNVTYFLAKPYSDLVHSLIGENILAPCVMTLEVLRSKPVNQTNLVYDITINPRTPNFALENGVVVHNSTRAEVLQKLLDRGYLTGRKSFTPSEVSFAVIDSLEKTAADITTPTMTSNLEDEMDLIEQGKKRKEEVVDDSRNMLLRVLKELESGKQVIGDSIRQAQRADLLVGKCDKCGSDLTIITTRRGTRFVGCTGYKNGCRNGFPLPAKGKITVLHRQCPECGMMVIQVKRFKARGFEMCINHKCKSKESWGNKKPASESKADETGAGLPQDAAAKRGGVLRQVKKAKGKARAPARRSRKNKSAPVSGASAGSPSAPETT